MENIRKGDYIKAIITDGSVGLKRNEVYQVVGVSIINGFSIVEIINEFGWNTAYRSFRFKPFSNKY